MDTTVYQGQCNICGWVSGTQTLSSRVGIETGVFYPWSIRNIIRCNRGANKTCSGIHPNSLPGVISKSMDEIVLNSARPFKGCRKPIAACSCLNSSTSTAHTQLRNKQWFYVGPVIKVRTAEEMEQALQSGPVTAIFNRKSYGKNTGNNCVTGGAHANSVIGYNQNYWYLQESVGKFRYPAGKASAIRGMEKLTDGTWYTERNSNCSDAILRRAAYPIVFYDYDKGNAYFTPKKVAEDRISYKEEPKFNSTGIAKRECSLMGANCIGFVKMESGAVKLIKSISSSKSTANSINIFHKTQMAFFLKHNKGKYVGRVKNSPDKLKLVKRRSSAMPFFSSYNRIISYENPQQLLGADGKLQSHSIDDYSHRHVWRIYDVNLRNLKSGKSMSVDKAGNIIGEVYNQNSIAQRFNLALSGAWRIHSRSLKKDLRKKSNVEFRFIEGKKYKNLEYLRWQARQVVTNKGKPFNSNWKLGDGYFKLEDRDNQVAPTDFVLGGIYSSNYLVVDKKNNIEVGPKAEGMARWTLDPKDIQ